MTKAERDCQILMFSECGMDLVSEKYLREEKEE